MPARVLDGGIFSGAGWELILSEDGWYLRDADGPPCRVSVGDAVKEIGKYGRAPVFRETREYIADLGRQLAESAYISPTAEPRSPAEQRMRDRGLDPKLPSEQIARAGQIIGRLGTELADAEAAAPIA